MFLASSSVYGQRTLKTLEGGGGRPNTSKGIGNDTLFDRGSKKIAKNTEAKIEDYKIISRKGDTTFVDTTLTIQKEYKFNYLRRDYFELLPFNNMGQTYNSLSHNISSQRTLPGFGTKGKHFNYMSVDDTQYYHVPTPLTELMFKSNFEQGQLLDAFFTTNTSEQFNFSIAYKGMRSLGKYQHILSSTGNFRFTTNYHTKNKRYHVRAHMVTQDILNQENGGISDEDLLEFENGNEEFIDRSLFDPLFEDAQSNLEGRRFYLDHTYQLKSKDSLGYNGIKIGNAISIEDKYYHYTQNRNAAVFGDAFVTSNLSDKNTFEHFYTTFFADYSNTLVGKISAQLNYNAFNYGYNSLVVLNGQTITNRLKESVLSFEGSYERDFGPVELKANLGINVSGDFEGNFLDAQANYTINDDMRATARINLNSSVADYNFRLYQSDYLNYNWQNSFKNQQSQQLAFDFYSKQYGILSLDYSTINNYLYFENKGEGVKPYQYGSTVNYARAKYVKEVKFRNFALHNTIMYQQVLDGDEVLNVPQLNTRHTLYYANEFFEKALYLQTGVTLSYFSEYNMNAYDPVLSEFYIQNQKALGNFPRLDFFINAKIQQTRLFLKAEHFNSAMTGYNFYSAPNYPYRDFIVRFGIVWNFFL
ncbi:putative porin [Flavobacteriaceae bacterium]|nr:putative porin [Flavobacteriaceae bacterium]